MSAGERAGHRGPTNWTTPADIEATVRRRWVSGTLLRDYADGNPFTPIEVPLQRPSSRELAERLDEARAWVASIERASAGGARFTIVQTSVGGKTFGRTQLPGRAIVETSAQAWRLLGVDGKGGELERFDEVLLHAAAVPVAREWVVAHPSRAIEIADDWPAILAARDWIERHRGSGRYLREIDAPGVDTKLVERRRGVLAQMLGVSAAASAFVSALGLAEKPARVRLRFDGAIPGLPTVLTEASFRVDELARLNPLVERALIVENEISYLSAPIPEGGVVLWGRGFEAAVSASLGWLAPVSERGQAYYWGDIDTHGFAILNQVRSRLPGVRSVMMDRESLLAHRSRWGTEPSPTVAALPHLTEAESALYADLVGDRYVPKLRLEQERIAWDWALHHLGVQ